MQIYGIYPRGYHDCREKNAQSPKEVLFNQKQTLEHIKLILNSYLANLFGCFPVSGGKIGRRYVFHCLEIAWRQGEGTCFAGGGVATGCAGGEEMLMFRIRICKRGLRRGVTVWKRRQRGEVTVRKRNRMQG